MVKSYHGSDHIINSPSYLGGKPDNDYGNGFYTTEYEEKARYRRHGAPVSLCISGDYTKV